MARNKYPEETRNLIIDTAARLFLKKGYEHTTVQDIIDNLGGLTKGAVYHHFKSKEEILWAVTDKVFEGETLSKTWNDIVGDKTISGAEKINKLLISAITDPHENNFRLLGINMQNTPYFLCDLMVRSVTEIAPRAFAPVLKQGIEDGSVKGENPEELGEIIVLLANTWLNPAVFLTSEEKLLRKFNTAKEILINYGIDISEVYEPLLNMQRVISEKISN